MKINFYVKLLIAFLFVIVNNASYSQTRKLQRVKVEYQNFLTESIDNVDCNSFWIAFGNTIQSKIFDDRSHLRRLNFLRKKFRNTVKGDLDIRGVVTFDYGKNQIEKYCFDRYGYFERKGMTFYNKRLIKYLDEELHLWPH